MSSSRIHHPFAEDEERTDSFSAVRVTCIVLIDIFLTRKYPNAVQIDTHKKLSTGEVCPTVADSHNPPNNNIRILGMIAK